MSVLPPAESFDVVVMCGALTVDHVGVPVVRELCDVCKPGSYMCCGSDFKSVL